MTIAVETVAVPAAPAGTLADLLRELGDIPPSRVRRHPPPGTATEADVIAAEARDNSLCELVNGTLVDKPMGFHEGRLAVALLLAMGKYLEEHDLGCVNGPDGMMRIGRGLVRMPDVSFVRWDSLPDGKIPRTPIPDLAPDLAVEVLSSTNTPAEMRRKLGEYRAAGTRLIWYIDPVARSVAVYTPTAGPISVGPDGTLDGGDVLPGFSLSVAELFARAERGMSAQ